MIMAEKTNMAMTDLDDLNRTLYDIGAQDLLDVWEAMEATVSPFDVLLKMHTITYDKLYDHSYHNI